MIINVKKFEETTTKYGVITEEMAVPHFLKCSDEGYELSQAASYMFLHAEESKLTSRLIKLQKKFSALDLSGDDAKAEKEEIEGSIENTQDMLREISESIPTRNQEWFTMFPFLIAWFGQFSDVTGCSSTGRLNKIHLYELSALYDACQSYIVLYGCTAPDERTGEKRDAFSGIRRRCENITNRFLKFEENDYCDAYQNTWKTWQVTEVIVAAWEMSKTNSGGYADRKKISMAVFQKQFLNTAFARVLPRAPKKETAPKVDNDTWI